MGKYWFSEFLQDDIVMTQQTTTEHSAHYVCGAGSLTKVCSASVYCIEFGFEVWVNYFAKVTMHCCDKFEESLSVLCVILSISMWWR